MVNNQTSDLFSRWRLQCLAYWLRRFNVGVKRAPLSFFAIAEAKRIGARLGRRTVRTKHGFRMDVDVADWMGQHVFATGNWEDRSSEAVRAIVQPGDVVLDVGANIGWFTLLAATCAGPTGKVYAFEPVPDVRSQLLANLALNGVRHATVRDEAASNVEGAVEIQVGPPEHRGVSSMRPNVQAAERTLSVSTVRIDDVIPRAEWRRVRLVKMDVEGAEFLALQGMRELLQASRPDLLMEMSDHFLRELGSSSEEVFKWMRKLGYRMLRIEWHGLIQVDTWNDRLPQQFNALYTVRNALPASLHEASSI